jgi:hypothetical protein
MAEVSAIIVDYIKASIEKSGIPLSHSLEAYLAITCARYLDKSIDPDRLTVRIVGALEKNAPTDILRTLADECLLSCSFLEDRLRRSGAIRHYVGLGQMAYDAAGMTEQAYGFIHMRDVFACFVASTDAKILLETAKVGSTLSRKKLLEQNVVIGPWKSSVKWL